MSGWESKLDAILDGIDKDQCDANNGWWETSTGAEFGAKKLTMVKLFIRELLDEKQVEGQQMNSEIHQEIEKITGTLEGMSNQQVSVPGDMIMAYQSNRPQLLRLVHRPFEQNEVEATLDLLAGQMEINAMQKRLISVLHEVVEDYQQSFRRVRAALDSSDDRPILTNRD